MQINSVTAGYSDPKALGRGEPVPEGIGNRVGSSAGPLGQSLVKPGGPAAEILGQYDVSDISAEEFSEMIQKLYRAGAITENEFRQLAAIRGDLDAAGFDADESTNLLEFYGVKISQLQRQGKNANDPSSAQKQLGELVQRLDWLEKFALIQAAPETLGLDAVA